MKLKSDYIPMNVDGTPYLVPLAGAAYQGVIRGNQSVAIIVECLKEETTEEAIVDALCAEYNAQRETVAADVAGILGKLREIDALEES
jgi:hypothetical protein